MPDNEDIMDVLSRDVDDVLNWASDSKNRPDMAVLEKLRLVLGDEKQSVGVRMNVLALFQAIESLPPNPEYLLALYKTALNIFENSHRAMRIPLLVLFGRIEEASKTTGIDLGDDLRARKEKILNWYQETIVDEAHWRRRYSESQEKLRREREGNKD